MSACEMWAPQTVTVKWNDEKDIVENQWFYDNTVSCNDPSFQVIIICRLFLYFTDLCAFILCYSPLFYRPFDSEVIYNFDIL